MPAHAGIHDFVTAKQTMAGMTIIRTSGITHRQDHCA
jgi:hypothetical protein